MRQILIYLVLFIALAIFGSSLSGCRGTTADSNAGSNGDTAKAEYPKISSALAQSTFERLDGSKFTIADYQGKVLLLNIWGTWCGPCRAEIPAFVGLQDQHKAEGFEVLGLNIGDYNGAPEPDADIQRSISELKINYTVARSPRNATAAFYAITKQQVVPQSMIVDRDGRVRAIFVGGGQQNVVGIQKNIERVLKEGN